VELSKQELDEVIRQTRANLRVNDDDEDSGTENDDGTLPPEPPSEDADEFQMETYDEEGKKTQGNLTERT